MIIEAGKFYRTENGEKVGPLFRYSGGWRNVGHRLDGRIDGRLWLDNGLRYFTVDHNQGSDIIAEWIDEPTGPVRTVTRKEIVPGDYNRVHVGEQPNNQEIWVGLIPRTPGREPTIGSFNAAELRAAAATLTEIADALDEQANGKKGAAE